MRRTCYAHIGACAYEWFIRVTWLIYMLDMTHSHVWHDSFMCVTWLIHMCDMTHPWVWRDWFICVTWFNHVRDMTHAYMWHDSCTLVTWLIHMCDMTHSYVWHDSFICVTWLIHMCDMTHSYNTGAPDVLVCDIWMSHVTYKNESVYYRCAVDALRRYYRCGCVLQMRMCTTDAPDVLVLWLECNVQIDCRWFAK